MTKSKLPSLEQLIRNKIQRRIFLAMFVLIAGAIFTSVVEATLSYSDVVARLEQRASKLQDLIISEELVNNRQATLAHIQEANRERLGETVTWIPPEQSTEITPEGSINWHLTGQWTFNRPLKSYASQRFGAFVFTGNFFSGDLLPTLSQRVASAIVLCILMGFLLLPLARRVPGDLILEPVHHLLDLVKSESGEATSNDEPKYEEIRMLEAEFRSLMAQKSSLEDERVEMQQTFALTRAAQLLAHDIRGPFSLIKAVLSGLTQASTPEDVRKFTQSTLPRVKESFTGLDTMLEELVMIGKPRSVSLDKFDVRKVVECGIDTVVPSYGDSGTRIHIDVADDISVRGTAAHLQRVIINLVANALQATGPNDSVHIKGKNVGSVFVLRVHNTGSYIPPEEQKKIFQPFYTKGKATGTGLGLAICKRIVTDHGGTIRVESSKDNGTEFIISLPIYNVSESLESASSAPLKLSAPKESLRVLVADDEIIYREAVVSLTNEASQSLAIHVVQATTGEEAIQIAMNTNSQVVIIDIDFGQGGLNGLEAVREMRRRGLEATICVHSNNTLQSTRAAALEAGANVFVPKPMTAESLEAVLSANRA